METRRGPEEGLGTAGGRRYEAPFRPDGSLDRGRSRERHEEHGPEPFRREAAGRHNGGYRTEGRELKRLIRTLGEDVSQLAHDEMTLAKLELRNVADTLSNDLKDAGSALAKDMAKIGVALSLATLAGLALTAGAILAVGELLGDAYWAGGLIVGAVLLIAAGIFGASAARDLKERESLRLGHTRARAEEGKDVMAHEAHETKEFAGDEARKARREL